MNDKDLEKKVLDHIETTNREMGEVKTDVAWLKKAFWAIFTASSGAFVVAMLNLVIQVNK